MVATTDCDRPKAVSSTHKVSKPLMEKKRRARINQCLDQLKSLLENHYSTTIRKRKLEKADILELTVRHLKHLQKMQQFPSVAPDAEYHTGFRSCVSSVGQYLLTAESLRGAERRTLCRLQSLQTRLQSGLKEQEEQEKEEEGLRTMDSAPGTRRPLTSPAPEWRERTASPAQKSAQTATYQIPCELLNDQPDVWRPW